MMISFECVSSRPLSRLLTINANDLLLAQPLAPIKYPSTLYLLLPSDEEHERERDHDCDTLSRA